MLSHFEFNSKIEINISHHINASEPDVHGQYQWYYEYDTFEFIDKQQASILTARSDSKRPFEASFIDLNGDHTAHIVLDEPLKPLFKFAVLYLKKIGKSKINYLSRYGYALVAPNISNS